MIKPSRMAPRALWRAFIPLAIIAAGSAATLGIGRTIRLVHARLWGSVAIMLAGTIVSVLLASTVWLLQVLARRAALLEETNAVLQTVIAERRVAADLLVPATAHAPREAGERALERRLRKPSAATGGATG